MISSFVVGYSVGLCQTLQTMLLKSNPLPSFQRAADEKYVPLCYLCELHLCIDHIKRTNTADQCIDRTVTLHHVPVGIVGDGVDVRRHLVALLALVHLDDLLRVDRQHLVGIHDHTKETGVGL